MSAPVPPDSHSYERAQLRALMRARRDRVNPAERIAAGRQVAKHVARLIRRGVRLGLYASAGSELPTDGLVRLALRRGAEVYLPRIVDYAARRMILARYRGGRMQRNRWGIDEPPAGGRAHWPRLDLLLLPLLAVDRSGHRLGLGGGYYDRLLAAQRAGRPRRPLLLGLAYHWQLLPQIPNQTHDVPLAGVLTERGLRRFPQRRAVG